jgi:4-amino-4-deoxy-L-arabinose transferase-like glycosyltransferase
MIAMLWRGWLIHTDSVKLNSDEAVVGLMARHITQGKSIPTFYYGQDYMGSLDGILIAGGFTILGESERTIRIVQAALYLLTIITAYMLALEVTRRQAIALMTALLMAVPTMLGTLYTSLTLGGYNELILFGNIALMLGWQVTVGGKGDLWRWALLGLVLGLGWWTNGAIITTILVAGMLGLHYFNFGRWPHYLTAAFMFFMGSAPWWLYNLRHDWAALDFLISSDPAPGSNILTLPEKILAFVLVGFSGLYGFRFPWEATIQTGLAVGVAAIMYLMLLTDGIQRLFSAIRQRDFPLTADQVILLNFALLGLVFIASHFQDATGRYLMPLWVPATIGIAIGVMRLQRFGKYTAAVGLLGLLVFQFATVLQAAKSETGITGQLDSDLLSSETHEAALIDFLQENDYRYGYTSYWVSYETMFKTGEAFIFDTSLPYDENGYRPHNNRYPPYTNAVAGASDPVWITQNLPELDALIENAFDSAEIDYRVESIGPFRVYHQMSERVAPSDFGLDSTEPIIGSE